MKKVKYLIKYLKLLIRKTVFLMTKMKYFIN